MAAHLSFSSRSLRLIHALLFSCVVGAAIGMLLYGRRAEAARTITASEKQDVLKPIESIFDGIAHADKQKIAAQMAPVGSATLFRDGKFLQMSLEELTEREAKIISSSDKFEEHMHDSLVRIDNNIAFVWMPYEATRNGKIDHCGTSAISLIHQGGRWLIASITDTSRPYCESK